MSGSTLSDVERGGELRRLRERAHLLQRQVGAAFDIDKASVSEWELGKSSPSLDKIGKLDELYGGTGEVIALFGMKPAARAEMDAVMRRLDEIGAAIAGVQATVLALTGMAQDFGRRMVSTGAMKPVPPAQEKTPSRRTSRSNTRSPH